MGGLHDEDRLFPWRCKGMTDRTTWVVISLPDPPAKEINSQIRTRRSPARLGFHGSQSGHETHEKNLYTHIKTPKQRQRTQIGFCGASHLLLLLSVLCIEILLHFLL